MRQIANATIAFTSDHKGWMPGRGGSSITKFTPSGGVTGGTAADIKETADWIAWQRKIDPVTGANSTGEDQNITYSAMAKYLGAKTIDHTSPQGANSVNATLESVYRCPSDILQARPNAMDNGQKAYRYSYSMNIAYTNPLFKFNTDDGNSVQYTNGQRCDGMFSGKISSIKNSSQKVLLICEDEQTIDDGTYSPNAWKWVATSGNTRVNAVSSRHQARRAKASNNTLGETGNEDARGNVVFCDGHGEFFGRKDALRSKFSGNPNKDPDNF
jgi:prepilin-type processing-associated H-X9-DG protein